MPKEESAGVVIFRRKEDKIHYLLLHYEAGHWDLPKGHVEQGETAKEAAKRETEEETGIKDLRFIEGFKEWIKYFFRKTYNLSKEKRKTAPLVFKIVSFYLAETKTKEIKLSSEHKGYKWLPFKEAKEQVTFKKTKEILEKAHKYLTE